METLLIVLLVLFVLGGGAGLLSLALLARSQDERSATLLDPLWRYVQEGSRF